MTDQPAMTFDEHRLRADIVKVWGPAGAHVDLFDHVLRLAKDAAEAVAAEREACAQLVESMGDGCTEPLATHPNPEHAAWAIAAAIRNRGEATDS